MAKIYYLLLLRAHFGLAGTSAPHLPHSGDPRLIDQPPSGKLPVAVEEGKRGHVRLAPAKKCSSLEVTDFTSTPNSLTRLVTPTRGLASS